MNLYYSPGACAQATHIVLHETGLEFEKEKVATQGGHSNA